MTRIVPALNRADVRFDWFEPARKGRHCFVRLTHIPTGCFSTGRGRTTNEAKNNGWVKLERKLGLG